MPKKTSASKLDPNGELAGRLLLALNHPIRRRILESLMREPASASMLAGQLGTGQERKLGVVSYHLSSVLYEGCDLVEIVDTHQRRGALEKIFALKPEAFVGAIQWAAVPHFIASGLRGVALNGFLKAAIAALEAESSGGAAGDPAVPGLYEFRSVAVDEMGHREISEAVGELAEKVEAVAGRCSDRLPTELTQLIVGTAAFQAAPSSAGEAG